MISILSASRRFEGYKKLVLQLESLVADLIDNYIVMVDDPEILPLYKNFKKEQPKIKIMPLPKNWIYNNGFDRLYNNLIQACKSEYCWMLFDTDDVEINIDKFKSDLQLNADVIGYPTYMQRGDSLETKYQLFKKDSLHWQGALHENQAANRELSNVICIESIRVIHNNAVDNESSNLNKSSDNFLILEKTIIGSDSDKRNLLYEGITWKIVHGVLHHNNLGWFVRHYEINKEVIDWYHDRAEKYYED